MRYEPLIDFKFQPTFQWDVLRCAFAVREVL